MRERGSKKCITQGPHLQYTPVNTNLIDIIAIAEQSEPAAAPASNKREPEENNQGSTVASSNIEDMSSMIVSTCVLRLRN